MLALLVAHATPRLPWRSSKFHKPSQSISSFEASGTDALLTLNILYSKTCSSIVLGYMAWGAISCLIWGVHGALSSFSSSKDTIFLMSNWFICSGCWCWVCCCCRCSCCCCCWNCCLFKWRVLALSELSGESLAFFLKWVLQ